MTLEEIQTMADKDLKINDVELDLESLKTPQLHNKYSKYHTKYMRPKSQATKNIRLLMYCMHWGCWHGRMWPNADSFEDPH